MKKVSGEVQRVKGVTRRPGTTNWQWGIKPPDELKSSYATQWAHRCTLATGDLRSANTLALRLEVEWQAKFQDQLRALNPTALASVSPELAKALALRLYAALMAADDRTRGEPQAAQLLIALDRAIWQWTARALSIGDVQPVAAPLPPMGDEWEGLSIEQADELAQINAGMDDFAAGLLARQSIGATLPMVQAEARALGFTFTPATPGAVAALREGLKAYRRAMKDRAARDRGEAIETPQAPSLASFPPKPRTLRDVFDRWKGIKTPDTARACERALILYEAFLKDPPLASLTRDQGDSFSAWLQQQGTTSKTARDRFTWTKSLLKYAARNLEWIPKHPWVGLDIASRVTKRRRPWTDGQLETLFSQPLYTAYKLPRAAFAGADAAYWVPLLGIYTGSRLSELCQLRVADIVTNGKITSMSITDDEDYEQQTKNDDSVRDVPVHSELVRLGFLDFVEDTQKAGHDRLFPLLPLRKGKPGGYFSNWFGDAKPKGLPDFHSFRHLVRTVMSDAGHTEPDVDRITGHTVSGSAGSRTYRHGTLLSRQRTVEAIRYEGLVMNRVYAVQKAA